MDNRESLAAAWLEAKRAENAASARRLKIEEEILEAFPAKEEGTTTTLLPSGTKIKTTGKLSFKADMDKLTTITSDWPEDIIPIRTKREIDEPILRQIRRENPKAWARLAPAVTVKPAKTFVQVEPDDGL